MHCLCGRELMYMLPRSAESVTPGHPDKICDQIADTLVDVAIDGDNEKICRMAAEVTGGHKIAFLTGEGKLKNFDEFNQVAEKVIRDQYRRIAWDELNEVKINFVAQSPDISQGVDTGGAGDQGCMIGYATDETPEMMPPEFALARKLSNRMYEVAMSRKIPWMHADGKTQVVLCAGEIVALVIAIQHKKDVTEEQIKTDLIEHVIKPCGVEKIPKRFVVNGTGAFVQGSWDADAGTTGRKLVVDNFGPWVPIGGGAYSGKDPTKVDRSAAYMARHVAKTIVACQIAGARACFVQLSYVIGEAEPTGILAISDNGVDLSEWVKTHFDLRPRAIIDYLNLWRPIFAQTAEHGHYGIDHLDPVNTEKLKIWTWEKVAEI